jgi:hypothetical protein
VIEEVVHKKYPAPYHHRIHTAVLRTLPQVPHKPQHTQKHPHTHTHTGDNYISMQSALYHICSKNEAIIPKGNIELFLQGTRNLVAQ